MVAAFRERAPLFVFAGDVGAGVNALIRGVDHVAAEGLPVITVMCTNRKSAIDPAVQRRAAQIFEFGRPNDEQRAAVLHRAFDGAGLSETDVADLVRQPGPVDGRPYGYTYSDLTMRLIPGAVIDAFPDARCGPRASPNWSPLP